MSDQLTPPSWYKALQGHDVVVVSPQYWGDYWVSKHWIAYELSRRLRTVFIEPPLWVGGIVRNPWKHRTHFRRLIQPLRRVDSGLYIFSPKFFPRSIEWRSDAATLRTVETLQQLGIQRPIVLNFGTNFNLVNRLHGAVTVYYCVDPPFPEVGHENDEVLTCQASDLVYAVSETYRQQLAPFCTTQPLHMIPHGYAFEHARRIAEDPSIPCPREIQKLPRPILGFVGSIHDSNVDIALVEGLAQRHPESSIVLIGPYQSNPIAPDLSPPILHRLRQLPNVHLIGPRHFLDVPQYVKYFDVCLVLGNLRDYDSLLQTSKRTLFKWLIYLALGKPVVAPCLYEAESISSLVYLASDDDSYFSGVDQALKEDGSLDAPRVNYASQFSFEKTLESIVQPITQFLHN